MRVYRRSRLLRIIRTAAQELEDQAMPSVAALAAIALSVTCLAGEVPLNAGTPTTVTYVDTGDVTMPVARQWSGSAWSNQSNCNTASSSLYWETVRNSPLTNELTLLTAAQDRRLLLQVWNGASWGSASALASDLGTYATRAFDAEYQQQSGNLMVVYRKLADLNIYYRNYTSPSPSEQSFAPGLNVAPNWLKLIAKPGTNEMVLLAATDTYLYGMVWNGTTWGNVVTLETGLVTEGWPFDSVYMTGSGQAMVVWGAALSSVPKYRTWTGSAWSAAATLPAVNGDPCWIKLGPSPGASSTEVLMGCADASNRLSACVWNGAAWGTMATVDTALATAFERRFDFAYQPDGANAVLLWHTSGQTALRYRTWSGTSWSGTLVGPDMSTETQSLRLTPGPGSSDVTAIAQRRPVNNNLPDFTVYSAAASNALGNSRVTGLVGQQTSGVAMPTPPSASPGSTNLSFTTTGTITPGAYGNLTTVNNVVLYLTAGTYVFKKWNGGNSNLVHADTSAGDITMIFTNGNVSVGNGFDLRDENGGRVTIHVLAGNFTANNQCSMQASLLVYAGLINLGTSANITGRLFASGTISVGSGKIREGLYVLPPSPSKLTTTRWSSGGFGAATQLDGSVPGYSKQDAFSLSAPPQAGMKLYVSHWHEIGQDE
jgi:hypothetical protein